MHHGHGLPHLQRDLNVSNLTIREDQFQNLTGEQRAKIQVKLNQLNKVSKFQPLKMEPGTQMKPKSKMRLVKEHDGTSEMNQTANSQLNHS